MTAHSFRSSRPCESITGKRQSGLSWSQINGRISPHKRQYRIASIAVAVVMAVVVGVFG